MHCLLKSGDGRARSSIIMLVMSSMVRCMVVCCGAWLNGAGFPTSSLPWPTPPNLPVSY